MAKLGRPPKVRPAPVPRGAPEPAKPTRIPRGRRDRPRPPDRPGVTRTRKRTDQAITYAMKLFRDQYSLPERVAMVMQRFGIAEATAREWISIAGERLRTTAPPTDETIRELREQSRVALEETYRDAKADRDHTARIQAVRERNRLFGLHAPIEVTHGGNPAAPIGLTIEDRRTVDLRAELAALTAKAREAGPELVALTPAAAASITPAEPTPAPLEQLAAPAPAAPAVSLGVAPMPVHAATLEDDEDA